MPNTDTADGWVALARRAAASMAAGQSDAEDFCAMYGFIGSRLAAKEDAALLDLESRLRHSHRDALNWY